MLRMTWNVSVVNSSKLCFLKLLVIITNFIQIFKWRFKLELATDEHQSYWHFAQISFDIFCYNYHFEFIGRISPCACSVTGSIYK